MRHSLHIANQRYHWIIKGNIMPKRILQAQYKGSKKTVTVSVHNLEQARELLDQRLSERLWSFGKHKYLTHDEAIAMEKKHKMAASQLFDNETLVIY
jgi:hypothetical protein